MSISLVSHCCKRFGYIAFFLLVTAPFLLGQPGSLSLASGTTTQGGTVSLNLGFTSSGSQPAGLQWTLTYNASDITSISVAPGPAATAAGKTTTCAGTSGSYMCLATGINANTIGNGAVAVVTVTVSPGVTSTTIGLSNTLGATLAGTAYAVTGTAGTIVNTVAPAYHVSSLSCTPASLQGALSSTCNVTLDAIAPAGGAVVALSSNNASLTVPQSATVPAGSNSTNFTGSSLAVTTDATATLTATANGTSKSFAVSLLSPAVLSSIQCNPSILGPNAAAACVVTLSKPVGPAGAAISLATTGLSSLTVPSSVTVAAGSSTASFTASTGAVSTDQSGNLTATYNGISQAASINVVSPATITSLQCSSTALGPNANSTCTVMLSKAVPATGAVVNLGCTGLSALTMPASVTVAAGSSKATFTVSTGSVSADQSGTISASYSGSSQSTSISLVAPAAISSLQCNPATLGANASSTCTATLSKAAPSTGASISLTSTGLSGLTVPANTTVAAGSSTTSFTVSTGALSSDQSGTLTATYNGTSQSANLSLAMATVVSSLRCTPTTLGSNATSNCTVSLSKAASGNGAVVTLAGTGLTGLTLPPSVTVAAGSTMAPFTLSTSAVGTDQNGTVSASYNGTSQTVNITLAATTVISSLGCTPSTIGAGTSSTCTVTLSKAAPDGGAIVTLSTSGLASLTVPASVTVTAGSTNGSFAATAGNLTSDQNGIVTATYNGTSQTVSLTVTAATVISSLVCSPTTLGASGSSTCTVTLSVGAPAGGIAVALAKSGLTSLTVPASINVPQGIASAMFTAQAGDFSTDQNGILTATYQNSSKTTNMNLSAALVISSLQCNPSTLGENSTSSCSVVMSKAAPAGGAVVALTSSGLSGLMVPASVSVAAGAATGAFTVSSGALSSNQNGTLTAAYNGSSKTVNMSLTADSVISSLTCDRTTLHSYDSVNCTVILSAITKNSAKVALTSTLPKLATPRTVMIAPNSKTGTFVISTTKIDNTQTGQLTASEKGDTESLVITITP